MKRIILLALPALLAGALLAGCGKDPVSPAATADPESPAIQAAIDAMPDLADGPAYESPDDVQLADPSSGSFATAELIHPVFFYRVIRDRQRLADVQVATEGDSVQVARVRIEDRLAGSFNLVIADTTDSGIVRHIVRKPLRDVAVLRAVFRRPVDEDPTVLEYRGWRLAAVSNREIASPQHATRIVSVRLQAESGLDRTITDPLALQRFPQEVPRLVIGERVQVTVRTKRPGDRVFLLFGWGRVPLRPVADGVFAGSFQAPVDPRPFRVGVNALDRATLEDDAAPYDSDFWGLIAHAVPPLTAAS